MLKTVSQEQDCHVGGVPSDKIHLVWDRAAPILETVITPDSGFTLEVVYRALEIGQFQLWVVDDFEGVVVTQIMFRPTDKILHATWLAGANMKRWLRRVEQELETWARFHDCSQLVLQGRKGFRAYEKEFSDYKPAATVYVKRLD